MNKVSELSDDLEAVSVVLGGLKRELRTHRRFISTLLHIFHGITDFRESYKVKYNLENIICMCLLIAMRGKFTSFYNAALFIKIRADYFRKFNLIKDNEIPSHDTLRRIFMNIDANELRDVIIKRIQEFLKKIVSAKNENDENSDKKTVRLLSGDGKNVRGSGRKSGKNSTEGKRNINVFNFYDASSGCCLTSIPLEDKDSEIPAFQQVLNTFKLNGAMITADALHCQRKTFEIITAKKGEYTVKVKDNQPSLKQHIIDVLERKKDKCVKESFNNCDYEIFLIDYKITEEDFPGAKAFICMHSHKRKSQANYNPEAQYFISSADNIQLIMEAIDNRWSIESGLHWWKDDFSKEDECTFTDQNAIKVMTTLNNISYALYRIASAIFDDSCMAETRIRFEECPEEMLAKLVPLLVGRNLSNLLKENMKGRKKAE